MNKFRGGGSSSLTTYSCQWTVPGNATLVAWSDQNLTSNTTRTLYANSTAASWKKCAYLCNAGSEYNSVLKMCINKSSYCKATHYECESPAVATNKKATSTEYTWDCAIDGTTVSAWCSEELSSPSCFFPTMIINDINKCEISYKFNEFNPFTLIWASRDDTQLRYSFDNSNRTPFTTTLTSPIKTNSLGWKEWTIYFKYKYKSCSWFSPVYSYNMNKQECSLRVSCKTDRHWNKFGREKNWFYLSDWRLAWIVSKRRDPTLVRSPRISYWTEIPVWRRINNEKERMDLNANITNLWGGLLPITLYYVCDDGNWCSIKYDGLSVKDLRSHLWAYIGSFTGYYNCTML